MLIIDDVLRARKRAIATLAIAARPSEHACFEYVLKTNVIAASRERDQYLDLPCLVRAGDPLNGLASCKNLFKLHALSFTAY